MRAIALVLIVLIAVSILFSGCVQPTTNVKVTNDTQASNTIADVGTDISGISQSLDDIDNTLSDTNSAQ